MISSQTIHIHPQAATKPAVAEPCNGCGVCCLTEPCPLGIALSGRRAGACDALRWQGDGGFYRCRAITDPVAILRQTLAPWLGWLAPLWAPALAYLARRWIGVGIGCDCALEVAPAPESDRQ